MSTISASTTTTTAYKVAADTTGTLVLQTGATPTTAVYIDTAQNVGVGVTPSAWNTASYRVLEFPYGVSLFGQTDGASAILATNGFLNSSYQWIYKTTAAATYYQQTTGRHQWFTAPSGTAGNAITFNQAMTLDASGNLIISKTTGSSISSIGAYNDTVANAANMYIDAAGYLHRSTSSLKYKNDVQDAVHGLAEVMSLRPVTYKGNNNGDAIFGGLIAEEVHEAGLTEFVQYAEDGTPDALAYGNMVSLCIKAIKEQQALITQLQADVAALQGAA